MNFTATRRSRGITTALLAALAVSTAAAAATPADQIDRLSERAGPGLGIVTPPDRMDTAPTPIRASARVVIVPPDTIDRALPIRHSRDGVTFGVRLDLGTGSGSFAACCGVDDAGPASVAILSFVPDEKHDTATFSATNTFDGTKGSITIRLQGTTGPLSGNHHVARGRWHVVSGTRAYAMFAGDGTFTAVTDQTTGVLTGIDVGSIRVRREHQDRDDQR